MKLKTVQWALVVAGVVVFMSMAAGQAAAEEVVLPAGKYRMCVEPAGFRYRFEHADGSPWLAAHATSGLEIDGSPAASAVLEKSDGKRAVFAVKTAAGVTAKVTVDLGDDVVKMAIKPEGDATHQLVARTGGLSPAYGLGDHAAWGRTTTEVSGYVDEKFRAQQPPGAKRLISNFVIFPKQGVAVVHMEKGVKIVRVTADELAQGSVVAREMPALYYFLGSPATIYAAYLKARNDEGYRVFKPKYEFFGVGWEAFGALGWNTNEQTVTENVERYLKLGYPLRWMVVGSGFWPNEDPNMRATTSFGLWDKTRYPDPKRLIAHFHGLGLKFFLGLRISFIAEGPYSAEGVARGYFLKENGQAKAYAIAFPKKPAYLLDGSNPKAVEWYVGLCQKWMDSGVDGFKEDLFGYGVVHMREGNIDAVNEALMDKGVFIMGRNGYLGSAADVHRFEDFNFDQKQDRGPINGLAFAYSGFPYTYPDIVGGTFGEGRKMPPFTDSRLRNYIMRYAQYASVNPSMAMGIGPWKFESREVEQVMLAAAQLHEALHGYIYSAAVDAYETGFPWVMTPLPVAYPDDANVHNRENVTVRGYQWMVGPSLLATPVYGDDYATAQTRDVYLPAGKWIDYDTGKAYQGPAMLKDFALPPGKTPLFVGGKGVIVLTDLQTQKLTAAVYPIAAGVKYRFTDRDGKTRSTIELGNAGWNAGSLKVHDLAGGGNVVAFETDAKNGSIRFPLVPGHDYRIDGGE